MIETSTTRWLTPGEVALILTESPLERIIGWAERGSLYGSWQGPDGWLVPAATVESWRRASDVAKAANASGKIEQSVFEGDDQDFDEMMEDVHWHHQWFSAEVVADILGIAPATVPALDLPHSQELPDGTWRCDDLAVERRRRVLVAAGDSAVSHEPIRHHWVGDGHAVG